MTPEAQRIAIAEACGWFYIKDPDLRKELSPYLFDHPTFGPQKEFPDYLNDLNAMHEAEKVLTKDQQYDYAEDLGGLGKSYEHLSERIWQMVNATAAQRAEAFLRTLGKWE